ncbi:hypothetical protein F-M6_0001 [Faustovirus]|nr:hypothetical protein F-M6_0001 [Faustovirus]
MRPISILHARNKSRNGRIMGPTMQTPHIL